jgi:uracil-DNA glycosylase
MALFYETSEFNDWIDELSVMSSTPQAENLYGPDPAGNIRRENLRKYFRLMAERSPELILVGEAPGYQGTRRTGVPFASEHIMNGGMDGVSFFSAPNNFHRVYHDRVYKEPTSTIMWRTISRYEQLPLLWATFPLHPHELGNTQSNRTPTRSEIALAKTHLIKLLKIVKPKTVLSLGNTAKRTLDELNISSQKLRHPARGGGTTFARQLHEVVTGN